MEDKLKIVQKTLRAIARSAMNAEFNMDADLSVGQWNSWTQEDVEMTLVAIEKYVEAAKQFLDEAKGGKND